MTLAEYLSQAAPEVTRVFAADGPLYHLVAKVNDDLEAAFDESVLHAPGILCSEDLRCYELLLDELKAARVPISALKSQIERLNEERRASKKQANFLIELANAAELYHAPDGSMMADSTSIFAMRRGALSK